MTKSMFVRPMPLMAVLLAVMVPCWAAGPAYIQADATISAKEIHAFKAGGENITIALGDFRLAAGEATITGRDAVLWIKTGSSDRHEITAYVEGGARATVPGWASLGRGKLLATLYCQGGVSAEGTFSTRPLTDFPLYLRAKRARNEQRRAGGSAANKRLTPHKVPRIIRAARRPTTSPTSQPATFTASRPASRPAGRQPGERLNSERLNSGRLTGGRLNSPAVAAAGTKSGLASPAKQPAKPPAGSPAKPIQPVNFHADQLSYRWQKDKHRWVTIARGNVYLSQGNPDSSQFVEMRSQAAVLFTAPGAVNKKDSRSPLSPKLVGLAGAGSQVVTGVYLEGDVVISRGERYFRGRSAYYDFTTDRAIVTDPVFRTIQKQRQIPIYIRASQARMLSARELWFSDAKLSTSEFYTPTYAVSASSVYLMDNTPYGPQGRPLGERAWQSKLTNTIFSIRGVPVFWTPGLKGDLQQGNSPLRKISAGRNGKFGWGVASQWNLFRLLGLVKPEGFSGKLNLDWMERGVIGGVELDYARKNFTGYDLFYGVVDSHKDSFGAERDDIPAPTERGRVLMRHKQFLPNDWQLQFELSYICDRNFMEEFFPDELFAGKEQETLFYAKKQKDNWAFTSLVKVRLNRFQTQAESYPDLGLYLIGQPLANDTLSFYHESHVGVKRFRMSNAYLRNLWTDRKMPSSFDDYDSGCFVRLDTREEVDLPLHAGPINLVPYAVGRLSYWGDDWSSSLAAARLGQFGSSGRETCRPYGQIGLKANTHVWAVFDNVESRLWDLHRLKHVITPEVVGWLAGSSGVYPEELFPMDPGIEEHLDRTSGMAFNVYQRLQTKRGPVGHRRTVDWMRLNLSLGIYDNHRDTVPSDGRFFWYRPENSLGRNHFNGEYSWNISDSTVLLADCNYDLDNKQLAKANIGIAVSRDPRLRYYAGLRYIDDVGSAVGTFGVNYQINRKYSISVFEQYDFAFDGGRDLSNSVTITRKLPRWYAAFTFSQDRSYGNGDVTMLITFWPEGIEEVKIGGGKLTLLGSSSKN